MKQGVKIRNEASLSHAVQAFFLTLAMSMLLPATAYFSEPDIEKLELRSVDTFQARLPVPPPEHMIDREIEHSPEDEPVALPQYEQARRVPPEPERIALPFSAALGAISGDFTINAALHDFNFTAISVKDAFELFDLDEKPVPLAQTPPYYPPSARAARIEGEVQIEFVVDEDGRVENRHIIESSPPGVFDRAVLTASRRWRFRPGVKGGRPVRVRVRQSFRFVLDD